MTIYFKNGSSYSTPYVKNLSQILVKELPNFICIPEYSRIGIEYISLDTIERIIFEKDE